MILSEHQIDIGTSFRKHDASGIMFEYLATRFNNPANSDFVVSDGQRSLHQIIVGRSPFFDAYLKVRTNGALAPFMIPPAEFDLLFPLLKCLYTNQLEVSSEIVI